jgi:hypothetical protein
VAKNLEDFAPLLVNLMTRKELHETMRVEARTRALNIGSWEQIFSGMYQTYERYVQPPLRTESLLLEDATKIMNA